MEELEMLKNAIHCIKVGAYQAVCKDCGLYPCAATDMDDLARVAIDVLEKRLLDVPVLPCKPGDKIYRIVRWGKRNIDIRERIVSSVEYNAAGEWVIHSTGDDVLGKNCFLTRVEAEKALAKRNKS